MFCFMCKSQKTLWGAIFPKNKQDQNLSVGQKPHVKQVKSMEITSSVVALLKEKYVPDNVLTKWQTDKKGLSKPCDTPSALTTI